MTIITGHLTLRNLNCGGKGLPGFNQVIAIEPLLKCFYSCLKGRRSEDSSMVDYELIDQDARVSAPAAK